VIYEDEHLLVVNKPAGLNTHAPAPHAGEGIYDWLRNREPRWASLAIIHRLDKDTSGVLVFAKTPLANRSLTEQFTQRLVHKRYVFLTPNRHSSPAFTASSFLSRAGAKYVSRPAGPGELAETVFSAISNSATAGLGDLPSGLHAWWAEPRTGRTHQIRVHAAEHGIGIQGDPLYSSANLSAAEPPLSAPESQSFPNRLCLHATELKLTHPESGKALCFSVPPDFTKDARSELRSGLIDRVETNAFRLIHGASDAWPGIYVDRLGDFALTQSEQALPPALLDALRQMPGVLGAYHKTLLRRVRQTRVEQTCPAQIVGAVAAENLAIRENALQFELSFAEGYSIGLFLDQRDNRRRLLTGWIGPGFPESDFSGKKILNTFAYTCGFSVCAARAGAMTTSLDLSKKYLEWGKRNFALNALPTDGHDFIFGDVFDWLRRFQKRDRRFDVVLLDPPTFSQSRESGVFQASKDYGKLVAAALGVLQQGGLLFASNNTADWEPALFLETVRQACHSARRRIAHEHYVPQPPDFPISRAEPAYLKTVWVRLAD
jgi:23S rRNA (cytosine1962-C5)-methyltransferase